MEVYITSFPHQTQTTTVSQSGAHAPLWSRDGRTLFYRTLLTSADATPASMGMPGATGSIVAVDVHAARTLALGTPRRLAPLPDGFIPLNPMRCVDQHPDGRFLVGRSKPFPQKPVTRLNVVHNWFAELERLSPKPR
jgi:hypothetical protein